MGSVGFAVRGPGTPPAREGGPASRGRGDVGALGSASGSRGGRVRCHDHAPWREPTAKGRVVDSCPPTAVDRCSPAPAAPRMPSRAIPRPAIPCRAVRPRNPPWAGRHSHTPDCTSEGIAAHGPPVEAVRRWASNSEAVQVRTISIACRDQRPLQQWGNVCGCMRNGKPAPSPNRRAPCSGWFERVATGESRLYAPLASRLT